MVVAHLVELSLPSPEGSSSSPVITKFIMNNVYLLSTVLKRQKIKKRGRKWPKFKNVFATRINVLVKQEYFYSATNGKSPNHEILLMLA